MVVGIMELHLALYDNGSLKEKRSVVKRVVLRTRKTFNVAAAEVEDQDLTDRAVIAVATVGNDSRHVQGLLDKVEGFVERMALCDILEAPKSIEVM